MLQIIKIIVFLKCPFSQLCCDILIVLFLVSESEARKCWKNIRQEYGKQLKRLQGRSGDGAEDDIVSQWPYFEKLHFLRDQFTPRQSCSNLMDDTQERNSEDPNPLENRNLSEDSLSEDEQSTSNSIANVMSPNSEDIIPTPSSSRASTDLNYTESRTGYRRRITPQMELGKQLVEIEREKLAIRANKRSHDPNDEDIGFFNSLLPYVKQLTPRRKLKFRMDVQKYLFENLFPPEQSTQTRPVLPARTEENLQFHSNRPYQPNWETNDFHQSQHPSSSNEPEDFASNTYNDL